MHTSLYLKRQVQIHNPAHKDFSAWLPGLSTLCNWDKQNFLYTFSCCCFFCWELIVSDQGLNCGCGMNIEQAHQTWNTSVLEIIYELANKITQLVIRHKLPIEVSLFILKPTFLKCLQLPLGMSCWLLMKLEILELDSLHIKVDSGNQESMC